MDRWGEKKGVTYLYNNSGVTRFIPETRTRQVLQLPFV